jgi:hypothetical protein
MRFSHLEWLALDLRENRQKPAIAKKLPSVVRLISRPAKKILDGESQP